MHDTAPPTRAPTATIPRRPFGALEIEGVRVLISHAPYSAMRAVVTAPDGSTAQIDAVFELVTRCATLADGCPLDVAELPVRDINRIAQAAMRGTIDPEAPPPDFPTPPGHSATGG